MKPSLRPVGALVLLAGLSACEYPTSTPSWDTTWVTPGEEVTVSVVELLPNALGVNADTSAFVLAFDTVRDALRLSEFCPACPPLTVTGPKPAFTGTVSTDLPLPADVHAIDVVGGVVAFELVNGFDFDPIRPGASSDSGSITVTLRSGGAVLATMVILGSEQSFAPGATLSETLDFVPLSVSDDLQLDFTLDSPAGDAATLSPSDAIDVEIASEGVLVSQATVGMTSQTIPEVSIELDLSGVDDADRFRDGTIFLEIDNPLSVEGTLNVTVDPAGAAAPGPFTKPVALAPGTTETTITFTQAEIQQLVGTTSVLTIDGVVSAVDGEVSVRPEMVITIGTRLRVTVEVGG